MALKFLWNGIKASDGKLQGASYSDGPLINYPVGTLTIYANSYRRFSDEIAMNFSVQNNSDSMSDYFEQDHIRVLVDHPLYSAVKAALDAQNAHRAKVQAKREARWASRRAA